MTGMVSDEKKGSTKSHHIHLPVECQLQDSERRFITNFSLAAGTYIRTGRESTILDLKAVVMLIRRKGKEEIQAVAFALMGYFFLSSMKRFRKRLERENN